MIALALLLSALGFLALALLHAWLIPQALGQWLLLALFFSLAVLDGVAGLVYVLGSWTL